MLQLLDIPTDVLYVILYFCSARDLKTIRELSRYYHSKVSSVTASLVRMLYGKYYPSLKQDGYFSNIEPSLSLLNELTTPRVVILRGFITYSFTIDKRVWKRCHDSRRDRGYFAMVFYLGDLYAIGTYSLFAAGTVERYNPFLDHWQTVQSLPHRIRSVGAAVLKDKLYVCGGIEAHTEVVRSNIYVFEESNSSSNSSTNINIRKQQKWITLEVRLLRPRHRHASVGYRGRIWIAGGCFSDFSVTNTVEAFDPLSNLVLPCASMLVRRDFANLLVVNDRLYAVGGDMDDAGNLCKRTIEMYDETCKEWVHVVEFPSYRRGFSTCAYENMIYIFAGCIEESDLDSQHTLGNADPEQYIQNTWDAFDTARGQWVSNEVLDYRQSMKMPPVDSLGCCSSYPPDRVVW